MRVAVTGGREFLGSHGYAWGLRAVLLKLGCTQLLHGGCRGADLWCERVAKRLGIPTLCFPYRTEFGYGGGPARNREMVAEAEALAALPGGTGTADCIRAAKKARIIIVIVPKLDGPHQDSWTIDSCLSL